MLKTCEGRAKEMWAKYDEEDKEKRTMRPDDGR